MTRQLVTLEVDGNIFSIRGWKAHGYALGAGLRPTYSGLRSAWVADTKRMPDLVAYLERRNIAYQVLSELPPGTHVPPAPSGAPEQLDLFDGSR